VLQIGGGKMVGVGYSKKEKKYRKEINSEVLYEITKRKLEKEYREIEEIKKFLEYIKKEKEKLSCGEGGYESRVDIGIDVYEAVEEEEMKLLREKEKIMEELERKMKKYEKEMKKIRG